MQQGWNCIGDFFRHCKSCGGLVCLIDWLCQSSEFNSNFYSDGRTPKTSTQLDDVGINADNSWDNNITYMHNAYETVRIHVALLPRTCSNLPNACKYTEWIFVWRENGLWTDRLCLTFLQICPNLQSGADGTQPSGKIVYHFGSILKRVRLKILTEVLKFPGRRTCLWSQIQLAAQKPLKCTNK